MALQKYQIIDAHLTSIAQGFSMDNAIYDQVLPIIPTPKISGKYIVWDKSSFKILSSRRAMGADVKKSDHDFTLGSFVLPDGYTRQVEVDDRQDKQTAGISNLSLLSQKTQIARRQMEFEKELEVANLVTNVSNYNLHGAPSASWLTNTTDIFGDIEQRKNTIADTIGEYPNKLIITRDVWAAMRSNIVLQSFFNTNPLASKTGLQPKMLADLFEIDEIIIAKASYINSGGTRSNIWGTAKAMLLFSAPSQGTSPMDPSDLPPSFGWTLQLAGLPSVRKGYDQKAGIEWAVIEDNWLGLQTSKDSGFFFDSVLG